MKIVFKVIIVYMALYSAIWLHEFGHALFYFVYGCKSVLFELHVPITFSNSNPGEINQQCYKLLSVSQHIWAALGGSIVNLLFAFIGYRLLLKLNKLRLINLYLITFILAHLIEVASYFTVANIFPLGDIVYIQKYASILRIPLGLIGIIATYLIVIFLKAIPKIMRLGMVIFTIVTSVAMLGFRYLNF